MVKNEVIKGAFSKLAQCAKTLKDYTCAKNKKAFIVKFIKELIDLKGVEEEKQTLLVENIIVFFETVIKLFGVIKTCIIKK